MVSLACFAGPSSVFQAQIRVPAQRGWCNHMTPTAACIDPPATVRPGAAVHCAAAGAKSYPMSPAPQDCTARPCEQTQNQGPPQAPPARAENLHAHGHPPPPSSSHHLRLFILVFFVLRFFVEGSRILATDAAPARAPGRARRPRGAPWPPSTARPRPAPPPSPARQRARAPALLATSAGSPA